MNKNSIVKNTIGIFSVILLVGLWMIFEFYVFGFNNFGLTNSTLRSLLNMVRTESADIYSWLNGTGIAYIMTMLPAVVGYYFTVLWKRRLNEQSSKIKISITAAVMFIAVSLSVLSVPDIYERITHSRNSIDIYYNLLKVNFIAGCMMIIIMIASVHIPEIIEKRKEIFSIDSVKNTCLTTVLTILITVIISLIYGLMLGLLSHTDKSVVDFVLSSFNNMDKKQILNGLIFAPIIEEMIFRGLIFGNMKKYIPVWAAIIFSSVIFGVWHRNLGQFVGTVPMGIVLASLYNKTGRLRYSMICHFLSNYMMYSSISSSDKGIYKIFSQVKEMVMSIPVVINILLIIVFAACIVLIMWKLMPKIKTEDENNY